MTTLRPICEKYICNAFVCIKISFNLGWDALDVWTDSGHFNSSGKNHSSVSLHVSFILTSYFPPLFVMLKLRFVPDNVVHCPGNKREYLIIIEKILSEEFWTWGHKYTNAFTYRRCVYYDIHYAKIFYASITSWWTYRFNIWNKQKSKSFELDLSVITRTFR